MFIKLKQVCSVNRLYDDVTVSCDVKKKPLRYFYGEIFLKFFVKKTTSQKSCETGKMSRTKRYTVFPYLSKVYNNHACALHRRSSIEQVVY